jgi:hypothetical protein
MRFFLMWNLVMTLGSIGTQGMDEGDGSAIDVLSYKSYTPLKIKMTA